MSRGDFHVVDPMDGSTPIATKYRVASGAAASIKAGEWVVQDTENVKLAVNGQSNTVNWIGVAATDSNDTTTAKGNVWIFDNPQYIFRGAVTTSGNLAETVRNTEVTLDIASSVQTIDEDDTTNGTLRIVDYNADAGTADVRMSDSMFLK